MYLQIFKTGTRDDLKKGKKDLVSEQACYIILTSLTIYLPSSDSIGGIVRRVLNELACLGFVKMWRNSEMEREMVGQCLS